MTVSKLIIAIPFLTSIISSSVIAEDKIQIDGTIDYLVINKAASITTFNRTPLENVLLSADVISESEIETSSATNFGELISQKSGIEVTYSGGPGSSPFIFMRGQASTNVVILIDGIKSQVDHSGYPKAVDIPLSQIKKIELLKGNASALYGENAIGGVINIITKTSALKDTGYASVKHGSFNTTELNVGVSKNLGDVDISIFASDINTDGYDSLSGNTTNSDKDGYVRENVALTVNKFLNNGANITWTSRISESRLEQDNAYVSPTGLHELHTNTESHNFKYKIRKQNWLDLSANYNFSRLTYKDFIDGMGANSAASYYYDVTEGEQNSYSLINSSTLSFTEATHEITTGIEGAYSAYDRDATTSNRNNISPFIGYSINSGKHSIQSNVRYDKIDYYYNDGVTKTSSETSDLLGYGYQLSNEWRIALTHSTGFRAPDAYSYSQNSNLRAEEHTTKEASVTYSDLDILARATVFSTKTSNAIEYDSSLFYNINTGQQKNQGLELNIEGKFNDYLYTISATFQEPKKVNSASKPILLQKRAKYFGSARISKSTGKFEFSGKSTFSGKRLGVGGAMSSYVKFDSFINYTLNDMTHLEFSFNNLFDATYEVTRGYNTAGRNAYITLKRDFNLP